MVGWLVGWFIQAHKTCRKWESPKLDFSPPPKKSRYKAGSHHVCTTNTLKITSNHNQLMIIVASSKLSHFLAFLTVVTLSSTRWYLPKIRVVNKNPHHTLNGFWAGKPRLLWLMKQIISQDRKFARKFAFPRGKIILGMPSVCRQEGSPSSNILILILRKPRRLLVVS